ncbi:VOC family protein [Nocardia farcinica]|nr:VOC family protein [Nocardia farcinica]MBF6420838.1 VOC family protein [Nocardia farcinica]MBF6432082.1 VOC family protein [Nocardia farcinica]MBF6502792.1 VOC family protein [Nocardia farcinica]
MMTAEGVKGLRTVVLDCPEPRELAEFYRGLLGGEIIEEESDRTWVALLDPQGRRLAFQLAPEYQPPTFPVPRASQQLHLDILVRDVEVAEPAVLALGAKFVQAAENFRVYTDPVGHTFCLVWLEE